MKIPALIKENIKQVLPLNNNWIRYFYYPRFRSWTDTRKDEGRIFDNRYAMYEFINNEVFKSEAIDYLEFGVYEGDSIRYWLELNNNSSSRFWGFDTFSGLPEAWKDGDEMVRPDGAFDTSGRVPAVSDNRVEFIKGLFQDTVTGFLASFNARKNIIIHNDSDLYSSSLYLLTKCDGLVRPGTVIIFDELSSWMNEFRALEDYSLSYCKTYRILCRTKKFTEVALIF
jgi:O-methyltransferase